MSNETKYQIAKKNRNCQGPCVYILTNPSMPELIKIGKITETTRSTAKRANELYTTGVPTAFDVYYEHPCGNPNYLEKLIHEHLTAYRVNPRREFFRFPVEKAVKLLKQLSNPPMCLPQRVELLKIVVFNVNERDLFNLEEL